MRKKILIIEKSDTIRNVADSLLRRSGYDVIAASSAEKAKELIFTAEPNMIIVGADLKDNDSRFIYELIGENDHTSTIPLLLIADPEGRELPYPSEVILPRPFDGDDLLERVSSFIGAGDPESREKVSEADPFSSASVDDEFLDAALGLDNIDVESSEVMNQSTGITTRSKKSGGADGEEDLGIAQPEYQGGDTNGTDQKVESLIIREDGSSETTRPKAKKPEELSASSKLDIPTDQFGMSEKSSGGETGKSLHGTPERPSDHDYSWFIGEMQKDTKGFKPRPPEKESDDTDGEPLKKAANGDGLEPVKAKTAAGGGDKSGGADPQINKGGVDKFISEFKKEMEKLSSPPDEASASPGRPESETEAESHEDSGPIETTEQPTEYAPPGEGETSPPVQEERSPQPVGLSSFNDEEKRQMFNRLMDRLADKLAERLIEIVDADKIYDIIDKNLPELLSIKK